MITFHKRIIRILSILTTGGQSRPELSRRAEPLRSFFCFEGRKLNMDKYASGVAQIDDFTGEIVDFFEFGSRVKLKLFKEDSEREVIITGREHTQIGGAYFGAVDTESILYVDLSEPEYDNQRRFIPLKERTRRALVYEIEKIRDLKEYSAEQEERDIDF